MDSTKIPSWLPIFFSVLPLLLVLALPLAVYSSGARLQLQPDQLEKRARLVAVAGVLWFAVSGLVAHSGLLLRFDQSPPPMFLLLACMLALSFGLVFSPVGSQLARGCTLAGLVGLQAFRFPLELAMHQAAECGLMPVQMSFEGRNWDIFTGIFALVLGLALARGEVPSSILWLWNVLGLGLLINVVTVAILSMPLPFRVFLNEPANTWVATAPYVWLPAIMVSCALIGHLLLFRRLWGATGKS